MNRQSKRYFKWKSGFTILVLVAMAIFVISIFSSDPSTVTHTKTENAKFADNKSETSKAATIQTTNQNENIDARTSHQAEPMKATAETTFKAAKPGTTDKIPVKLVKAVDGDTAKLKYRGHTETFRFLLIDTPETKHPRVGKQPFGQEAANRTAELLQNATQIEVEFDVGQKQDKYRRYLGYIYVDGEMLNDILVREGLGKVGYVYPPNTRYLSQLEASQEEAKEAKPGIWSLNSALADEAIENDDTLTTPSTADVTAKQSATTSIRTESKTSTTHSHAALS